MDRILIALDTGTAAEALALAETLRGVVGGFKVGHQLFTSAGPDVVRTLVARGDRVYALVTIVEIAVLAAAAAGLIGGPH